MSGKKTAILVAAAAIAGYVAGGWKPAVAEAARDEVKELMETDRAFDRSTAAEGLDAWVSFFAEDAIMMPAGGHIVAGKEAIRELMEPSFAAPEFILRWEPIGAEVSRNLGYTYGLYQSSRPGKGISHGKYLTVWRKQRDRSWRVVADIGNTNPPPTAEPAR